MTDLSPRQQAAERGEAARLAHAKAAKRHRFSDYRRATLADDRTCSYVDAIADLLIAADMNGLDPAAIARMAKDHANVE